MAGGEEAEGDGATGQVRDLLQSKQSQQMPRVKSLEPGAARLDGAGSQLTECRHFWDNQREEPQEDRPWL